jgi:hypothetical protein
VVEDEAASLRKRKTDLINLRSCYKIDKGLI